MDKLISCKFNIDTACVDLRYADGEVLSIDCIAVENGFGCSPYTCPDLCLSVLLYSAMDIFDSTYL